MRPNLVFENTNSEKVSLLKRGFQAHPQLTARELKPFGQKAPPNVDAFYVSIMAAERWGAGVRPVAHQAQVFRTAPEDQAQGWPPFVIAGLALKEGEDPFDARFALRLIIMAVIKAVRDYNAREPNSIRLVGFESGWTGIDKLPPLEAANIICSAYDEAPD
jgi:hypothetical protein